MVCESSDVRKFMKKSKFQNLKLKLEIIIDGDSNMRAFTYDVCSNLGCMQDTFARATYSTARPSAIATIGYLVYNNLGVSK